MSARAHGWGYRVDTQHVATSLRSNAAYSAPVLEGQRVRKRGLPTHCLSAVDSEPSQDHRAVFTDAAVPEGHRDLHGFLYGEGGAEVHTGPSSNRYEPIQVWPTCLMSAIVRIFMAVLASTYTTMCVHIRQVPCQRPEWPFVTTPDWSQAYDGDIHKNP